MSKSSPTGHRRGLLSRLGIGAKKWENDHLPESHEISPADTMLYGAGTTTVASLMASGTRQARTRQAIYNKWSQMEADPIVSSAVKLLVTSALGGHETTGDVVFIEKRPAAEKDERLGKIVEEIREDLSAVLNRAAYPMAYLGSVFGDSYARIYTDSRGVVDLYTDELVRPPLVQPFDRGSRTVGYAIYTGERNFQRLDTTQLARLKMPRSQWVPQHGVFEKSLKLTLTTDDVNELPLMPAMAGGSLIYPAEDAYDNLTSSLLGLVGQRWMDSIDEQMLTVNLNDMSKDMQEKFMSSVTDMLKRSKEVAEEAVKGGRPIMERIRHVIPVFGDKQLTRVEGGGGQTGRADNVSIEDVMLHARLLAGAIGVDLSMIGFADQMSGGLGEGGFFRTSAQAAESARVIRVALSEAFNHIIDMHTLKRYGMVFPASERPWRINFYGSISALEAERQRTLNDGMSVGLGLAQAIGAMRDMGADKKILRSFLTDTMQLDEEQAELYAQLAEMGKDDGGGGQGWP
ncbi:hypothetical protein [Halomonas sp. OfavH-34-E]|uniref:hypothetical protein n=1 Tax=Halomonas sp. OfavH-34-E TaxID=2954491 RepID=UPI002096C63F|nr:hypothetical protein [Halomonas sp. OfavH-34-E]MCO7216896.1 hypothetical protein [Halomonas sp. OfavH-34-E]